MKKAFISTVSLALVFSMALSFASCEGDDDATKENTSAATEATQTNAPQATEGETEKATDRQTDTPDESEPIEDSATNAIVTEVTVTDAPETKQPQIIVQTTKAPETSAPAEDTTKAPETEAPVEDTTSEVTTKPEEDTKAPATTAPGQDPNVDYSEWGKHGFENLLPIPLPFSDEEANWKSKKEDSTYFKVKNYKMIYFEDNDDFVSAIREYAERYVALGYTPEFEKYVFMVYSETELFTFTCSAHGYVSIEMLFL